jgi:hypothetical protein
MRIGISGHQHRPGIDWIWVRENIDRALTALPGHHVGYSSLATGADQIFAEAILDRGDDLLAIIPLQNYDACFEGNALRKYRELKAYASVVQLEGGPSEESAFFKAGMYIVDHAERMIVIWDGKPSQGLGGTADVVTYARTRLIPVVQLNPIAMSVENL